MHAIEACVGLRATGDKAVGPGCWPSTKEKNLEICKNPSLTFDCPHELCYLQGLSGTAQVQGGGDEQKEFSNIAIGGTIRLCAAVRVEATIVAQAVIQSPSKQCCQAH